MIQLTKQNMMVSLAVILTLTFLGCAVPTGNSAAHTVRLLAIPGITAPVPIGTMMPCKGLDYDSMKTAMPTQFQIGNTEITYALWYEVKNWRDSMVWCNALTEYYNARNGSDADLKCVYTYLGSPMRTSSDSTDPRNIAAAACDAVVQVSTSTGYRLPTSLEWKFAARYRATDTTNSIAAEADIQKH